MNKKYKIAMVAACPFPYGRGTPIRILKMAEALSKRGHEIHILTYHIGNVLTENDFQVHRIPNIKTYNKLSPGPTYQKLLVVDSMLAIKLYNFLKKQEIDIIHSHNYEGLLISSFVRRWTGHPLIYDAHTLLESELPYYKLGLAKKMKKKIGLQIDLWLPKKADHIITVTERIRTKLIQAAEIPSKKITVIMNGVNSEHFKAGFNDKNVINNDKKTLIFTGNLAPYQRIDLMLKAFRQILNERKDVRLSIITDSSFDHYESLANELGIRSHIDIIPSEFESLPKYFSKADIALNPRTECDGVPQKLLNYMAARKPIVSFESSAKNLVNGISGLVVEDGNISAFANAVLYLLNAVETAKDLGENAWKIATTEFTWEKTAEKTEAVYEQILNGNKSERTHY